MTRRLSQCYRPLTRRHRRRVYEIKSCVRRHGTKVPVLSTPVSPVGRRNQGPDRIA